MKVTSENAWPPGFRFHPTDEELVLFHLKRKICKKKIKFDIIAETDVYKCDPEELPGQSLLKTGDRQWFFFTSRDRRYPNGARSNRATQHGYWKATGNDRNITCNSRNVGVKKTLVFYRGRAPRGNRTDWVMHEYTLDEEELQRCQNVHGYYALYKVFKKSGPGPKNGEQYGAPFKEEDWDDEDIDGTKTSDLEIPAEKPNEATIVDDMKPSGQVPSVLDDIEELIYQLADEPLLPEPQIGYAYDVPQVVGEEEAQSTLVNSSSREVLFSKPISVCNEQASFDFTQSAASNLQLHEMFEATSAPNNCEQTLQICEDDFLEMDDLIAPQPTLSNTEEPVENLQFDDFDGLSELDLFHDAAMFLHDLGPVDQEAITIALGDNLVNQVDYQFQPMSVANQGNHQLQPNLIVNQMDHQLQPNSMVNQMNHQLQPNLVVNQVDCQMQPNLLGAEDIGSEQWMHDLFAEDSSSLPWMNDQLANYFTPAESNQGISYPPTSGSIHQSADHPSEANQNQSGQEGVGATSLFASSLWAFVESIPTTPASASENPLVNRAFERMSSFSRMRITARNPNIAVVDAAAVTRGQASSNRGFFLLSILGALCAILWMLMGTMRVLGRCMCS